jgi:FkbM family methyltransferase
VALTLSHRFIVRVGFERHERSMVVQPGSLLRSVGKKAQSLDKVAPFLVDCTRLLKEANRPAVSKERLFKVKHLEPPFWISLHDDSISRSVREESAELKALEEIWRKQLLMGSPINASSQSDHLIVDVSAGIGYFGLSSLAATFRRRNHDAVVHSFEVNPAHNLRLCESLAANQWTERMKMYSVGVADRVQGVPYKLDHHDQPLSHDSHAINQVLSLDEWAASSGLIHDSSTNHQLPPASETASRIKILHIGGETNLQQVIMGAQRLLRQRVVENIFCTINARDNLEAAQSVVAVSLLVESGFRLVGYGNAMRGPVEDVLWSHDALLVGNLVDAAQHRKPVQALAAWFQYPSGNNKAQKEIAGLFEDVDSDHSGSTSANKTVALPTIECKTFMPEALSGSLGFEDPNLGMDQTSMQQHVNHTSPAFWISLHNQQYDNTRWGIKTSGRYYKTKLEKIWRTILSGSPRGSHVLDLGSNIGYFTLLSLAMGEDFVVHAFEPNSINFVRLCESLKLNRWTDKVRDKKLFANSGGVSDRDAILPFLVSADNPGASQFLDPSAPDFRYKSFVKRPVVSLDSYARQQGWIDRGGTNRLSSRPPTIAILKVDVEGMEHRVLAGASRLLASRAIQNVFLELSARDPQESANSRKALELLIGAGYKLVGIGNWAGPGNPVPWVHDAELISSVLAEADKQDSKQLHVWFKAKD